MLKDDVNVLLHRCGNNGHLHIFLINHFLNEIFKERCLIDDESWIIFVEIFIMYIIYSFC